jgi:DNA polymerase/3'-5' exonuclease PolX
MEVAGSVRRGTYKDGDPIEVVIDQITFSDYLRDIGEPATGRHTYNIDGKTVSFYPASTEQWGSMLIWATGNRLFNVLLRAKARDMNYTLNQYGLWMGKLDIAGRSEDQIFDVLGVYRYPPTERNFKPKMYLKGDTP